MTEEGRARRRAELAMFEDMVSVEPMGWLSRWLFVRQFRATRRRWDREDAAVGANR